MKTDGKQLSNSKTQKTDLTNNQPYPSMLKPKKPCSWNRGRKPVYRLQRKSKPQSTENRNVKWRSLNGQNYLEKSWRQHIVMLPDEDLTRCLNGLKSAPNNNSANKLKKKQK